MAGLRLILRFQGTGAEDGAAGSRQREPGGAS